MTKSKYKIELVDEKSCEGEVFSWWRVKSLNGQILVTSECYKRRATRDRIARNFATDTGIKILECGC